MHFRFLYVYAVVLVLSFQSSNLVGLQSSYPASFKSGIREFSANFYKSLAATTNGNCITSPFGVLTGLSILALAAENNSRHELITAIQLAITRKTVTENYQRFIENLRTFPGVNLYLANKLFIKNLIGIRRPFQNFTETILQSEIENIDFENTPQAASKINYWSKKKTAGKITKVVTINDLNRSLMMMVSAVYFKGTWVHRFDGDVAKDDFFLTVGNSISVPIMCSIAEYNHGEILNSTAQVIELPYQTYYDIDDLSMFIIIPNEINGLDAIENNFHEINFAALNFGKKHDVNFCMPKFYVESKHHLIPALQHLGIYDAFHESAVFSNMILDDNLKVTDFIQKAFLIVDEDGMRASASRCNDNMSIPIQRVKVDRPFISAVVSKETGIPLFVARIKHPRW